MHIGNEFDVGHAHVRIIHDADGGNDPTENDEAIIMAVLHRRYTNPAQERGLTSPEAIAEFAEANQDTWREFPLFMYEHGNSIYRVSEGGNPFSCPWDSGRVGSLFVKLADVGDPREAATTFCEEYTDWANGNIWGYVVSTPDDDNAESCWGFVGDPDDAWIVQEATEAARSVAEEYDAEKAREAEAERPDMYTGEG